MQQIEIIFINLEKSELAREIISEKIEGLSEVFEKLGATKVKVSLELNTSTRSEGPDFFTLKFAFFGGRPNEFVIIESDPNMYKALNKLSERLIDKIMQQRPN